MAQIGLKGLATLDPVSKYLLFEWPLGERAASHLELFHGDGPSEQGS
jgi:hypothetical protein